jgi:hypothetical protein
MNSVCRFCRRPIEIPMPEDQHMRRLLMQLMTKACCNRCADYQRGQRDRAELLGRLGLMIRQDPKPDHPAREMIRRTCLKMVTDAESHYLVSGWKDDADMMVQQVFESPDRGEWIGREFVRLAAQGAREAYAQ